jgi:hypothetical protein
VTARADLVNAGPASASSIVVRFDLVPSGSTLGQTLRTVTTGTLAPNSSTSTVTTVSLPSLASAGTYRVVATASSAVKDNVLSNNTAAASVQVQIAAPAPTPAPTISCVKYQSYFDGVHQSAASSLNAVAASGDGWTYYNFSYAFDGILGMFEGTRDVKYLNQALVWAEQMVASATIVDIHGKRNWRGTWQSPYSATPITHQLFEFQGAPPLARLARIILTDPGLRVTYGVRAQAIQRFVKDHIVDKWLYARKAEGAIRSQAANNRAYPDSVALFTLIVLDLGRIDGNPAYLSLVRDLLDAFTARLQSYSGGSLIWDVGKSPEVPGESLDTSHANRFPYMVSEAYEAGIGVTQTHTDGLARLLTDVIWDQSTSSPRFTNLIDGTNPPVFGYPPYGNGQIYSGWATLGVRDSRARMVAEATLQALIAGMRNPSLDLIGSSVGKMALTGHVTRNMRLGGICR